MKKNLSFVFTLALATFMTAGCSLEDLLGNVTPTEQKQKEEEKPEEKDQEESPKDKESEEEEGEGGGQENPPVTNFTVHFVANGGTGNMDDQITNGSNFLVPDCTFTYDNHTFSKWALDGVNGAKYSPGNTITQITEDFALFAIWDENGSSIDEFDGYYDDININSSTLLKDLRELNLEMRTSTVGYKAMGTTPSGYFRYTDYDPSTVQYDQKGQPYGTKILSFYSGTSTTSWNREHVWPNSRGGGSKGNAGSPYVDQDIYMPRPTISAENSNRGNSCYVEGMEHQSNGWDPVKAFGVNGCYKGEGIRGECARIIFYCMTVNSKLELVDDNDASNSTETKMGKLSDLLKWNLKYGVNEREVRRQSGGQYLQGNRNAFVDHPEYACKIWGATNSATKAVCGIN